MNPEYIQRTQQLMDSQLFERYIKSFDSPAPVSIRLNPQKTSGMNVTGGERVPWCKDGWYLNARPNFTQDPLLHAGCYYVQEAASMFIDEIIRQCMSSKTLHLQPTKVLDMCAAPGGKSTLLRSALPSECILYANEPNSRRANILAENIIKWGQENCIVTCNTPQDYTSNRMTFDIILCDVPCSGEGMFRKDIATQDEWSPQQVERCSALQREIVANAWECLNCGGVLIYSTCTFNTKENEENIRWIINEYDAEIIYIHTEKEWGITGSLLNGFQQPVCRFIPGVTQSEGLFVCAMRKNSGTTTAEKKNRNVRTLNILADTNTPFVNKSVPTVELSYQQAIAFLRREAIALVPQAQTGLLTVTFQGIPLGMVKNVGNRANNLYPKEWRIRTTHISNNYEAILKPA